MLRVLLFALAALLSINAYSKVTKEPIIAITDGNLPPFAYAKNDKLEGVYVEIVKNIFQEAKLPVSFSHMPFARAMLGIKNTPNAMYFPMGRTKDRINDYKWIGPILEKGRMNLYRLKNRNDIKITSLEDAKNYTVGVVRGYSSQRLLKSYGFENGKNLIAVTNLEQNVKKLMAKRVDLIVAYADSDDQLIEMYGMTNLGTVNVLFLDITTAAYLAFNKEIADEHYQKLKQAYLTLHKTSLFQDIATKHLNKTMQLVNAKSVIKKQPN